MPLNNLLIILPRIMASSLFIYSGLRKILLSKESQSYFSNAFDVDGRLVFLIAIFELSASLAIILNYKPTKTFFLISLFTLTTGFIFHSNIEDPSQLHMLLKHIVISGLFLMMAMHLKGLKYAN